MLFCHNVFEETCFLPQTNRILYLFANKVTKADCQKNKTKLNGTALSFVILQGELSTIV